jgi:TRAP-type C4-dicarboxylate transport system permease small subunit
MNPKVPERGEDGTRPARGPTAWLFYLGAAALLFAMCADAIAVLGRHVGLPLLGSIELVQAGMLVASSAAIVAATLAEKHAVVHLLIDRLSPEAQAQMRGIHAGLCVIFFILLAAGSIWIACDLRGSHEESEILKIPYAPLRMISIAAVLAVALIYLRRIARKRIGS